MGAIHYDVESVVSVAVDGIGEIFNGKKVKKIISDFNKEYAIIKYDKGKLSLIESNNWDTANEPDVGNSYCFDSSAISSDIYKIIKGKIDNNVPAIL